MSRPVSDQIFTMMGCAYRRDRYAKAGDVLEKHAHSGDHGFDHGAWVEHGSAKVVWYDPPHEATLVAGQSGAAMFRKGRFHSIEALEDNTIVMSVMPGDAAVGDATDDAQGYIGCGEKK